MITFNDRVFFATKIGLFFRVSRFGLLYVRDTSSGKVLKCLAASKSLAVIENQDLNEL